MNWLELEQTQAFADRLSRIIETGGEPKGILLLVRQLMEAVYKALSADSRTSFNGFFARMQYVHENIKLPASINSQINGLRIAGNSAAHDPVFTIDDGTIGSGVLAIRELLKYLNDQCDLSSLSGFIESTNAKGFEFKAHSAKESFEGVVQSWKINRDDNRESSIEIDLINSDGNTVSLFLRNENSDNLGRQWSVLGRVLWKYATLSVYDASISSGRENSYTSNPTTLIVLEPDFLLDASAISECFSAGGMNPENYIINRLVSEPSTDKMLQGTTVNNIFDELLFNPDGDYQELFRKSLAQQPISMVAIGFESATSIYNSIKDIHLPRIRDFARNLQNEEIMLEPSFLCPEYGLQGRLDLLYRKEGKYYIVELKSGKAPAYDLWIQHHMQVIAYNMIIRNSFGKPALGTSAILYTAAGSNNLRHVVNTVLMEQNLLTCRNRIVGLMHILASEPERVFSWMLKQETADGNRFIKKKLEELKNLIGSLEGYEYQWFLDQVRLTVREIWFVKTGSSGNRDESIYGHNALWQQSPAEKKLRYRVIDGLEVIETAHNLIRLAITQKDYISDFRENDIVVLYRADRLVSKQEILRGVITRLDDRVLELMIRGGLKNSARLNEKGFWVIEHDVLETSLYNPLSSIVHFLRLEKIKRSIMLGRDQPRVHNDIGITDETDYLTNIIAAIEAAKDYYIIQGPPGTGKTSGLLTDYLKRQYQNSEKHILVLSFTNRAVDEICHCLKRNQIDFIRTGSSQVIEDDLLSRQIEGKRFAEIEQIVKSNRIWVATVQSCNAWINDFTKMFRIDELVIDEASQIIENNILGIIARAEKTILIGDQNQLPPISVQSRGDSFSHPELKELFYGSYCQSLMERLYRNCIHKGWNHAWFMLHRHYRMHDEIAGLVQKFYSGRLISMREEQKAPLVKNSDHLILSSRIVWVECPRSDDAYFDLRQARIIIHIIKLLKQELTIGNEEIGIVAPFRAMIHALRQKPETENITIDTVERFQGSERRVIIISLPLKSTRELRGIEALSDDGCIDRKLNVAVSRAKERLIILGNMQLCRSSAHYAFLMDKIAADSIVIPYDRLT
ncbi:MAG: AAA domain-containing protein [Candidatus Cloacimonadaceae bacterium]|nr:AAA domain-containing protein [Candidatus Cloacimonadaceae bacterium]